MSSHMELPNPTLLNTQPQGQTHPTKSPSFANGVLKRHAPPPPLPHHPIVVSYKECLKNHAASLGGHALDGCGEFMPSPASNPADPTSLKCAACGCHRNFHRREPDDPPPNALPALEYHPLHRHHPPPPAARGSSPDDSPSPPPISSSFYPSAPHMLMALSHGLSAPPPENSSPISAAVAAASTGAMLSSGSRKRYRTKFTQFQKERLLEFAEKVEWKMQKREEDAINEFCNEVGVDKGVFKVWMHNNKNTFAKKDQPPPPPPNLSNNTTEISSPTAPTTNSNGVNYCAAAFRHQQDGGSDMKDDDIDGEELGQLHLDGNQSAHALGINGSSSS